MSGRDIGGAYKTDPTTLLIIKLRHEALRDLGLCINGGFIFGRRSRSGIVHGKANPVSGKCSHCEAVAKRTRKSVYVPRGTGYTCGACGAEGHNRRTCVARAA